MDALLFSSFSANSLCISKGVFATNDPLLFNSSSSSSSSLFSTFVDEPSPRDFTDGASATISKLSLVDNTSERFSVDSSEVVDSLFSNSSAVVVSSTGGIISKLSTDCCIGLSLSAFTGSTNSSSSLAAVSNKKVFCTSRSSISNSFSSLSSATFRLMSF